MFLLHLPFSKRIIFIVKLINSVRVGHATIEIATTPFKNTFGILVKFARFLETHKHPSFAKKIPLNKNPVVKIGHGFCKISFASATRLSQ
jgi:hypothetical protein